MERTSRVTTGGGESRSRPLSGRRGYPQIYGKGRISGNMDELFETMIIGTLASDSGTHFPIMASRVKRSTLS